MKEPVSTPICFAGILGLKGYFDLRIGDGIQLSDIFVYLISNGSIQVCERVPFLWLVCERGTVFHCKYMKGNPFIVGLCKG